MQGLRLSQGQVNARIFWIPSTATVGNPPELLKVAEGCGWSFHPQSGNLQSSIETSINAKRMKYGELWGSQTLVILRSKTAD